MQSFQHSDSLEELLNRAVRAKQIIVNAKAKHKLTVESIKEKRNQLMIEMTQQIDGSVAQSEIERSIDSLDQKEFKLHSDFRKILSAADTEINEIIEGIMRQQFGPNWSRNQVTGDARNNGGNAT